ncbi:response regulator [Mesonia aquimarina]|uniref:response regulator n=1 Tax=Mesonia aquimarina TaxID=1504967 RepID=UPI000EF5C591|nr:response regulator [Mesonia aquimarina]
MSTLKLTCIIDDDPIYVFGIQKVMDVINFCESTLIFKNGRDALDNLSSIIENNENIPDVILLDLNMPIMDGWEFLDEFIKIPSPKKVYIYVISSSIDPKDVNRVKRYQDVKNYIIKPVGPEQLSTILKDFKEDNFS